MKKLFLVVIIMVMGVLGACNVATKPTAVLSPIELTLVATDIAYDNNRLEVKAGQVVKLTLQNDGVLEHDFSIMTIPYSGEVKATEMAENTMPGHDMSTMDKEPDVHVAALMNTSNSVEFTPSTPGAYQYYCTVEGHKEAGMIGTLAVTAP